MANNWQLGASEPKVLFNILTQAAALLVVGFLGWQAYTTVVFVSRFEAEVARSVQTDQALQRQVDAINKTGIDNRWRRNEAKAAHESIAREASVIHESIRASIRAVSTLWSVSTQEAQRRMARMQEKIDEIIESSGNQKGSIYSPPNELQK